MYHLEAVCHMLVKFVVRMFDATKFHTCKGNRFVAHGDEVHGSRNLTEYQMKILIGRGEFLCYVKRKLCYIALNFVTELKFTAASSDKEKTDELPDGTTSFCFCAFRNA